ncbi:hydantoinase B/oxoprolinase family protein [Frankia sp. Cas3]|uniref:hydantoinase B/oxoprolinase family protein n=1 Tax=Frankia sp. Cas3 TaxID=3073926 RepID=UPI002AD3770E|nr:hydantoinase B/oxoprolinase family protein [Frankia sp. Cas3]
MMTTQTGIRNGTGAALRDLGDTEFEQLYQCDRFTASVISSRFRYIMEHVCSQLITYAFSPQIRESTDISAAVTGPPSLNHAMPAVAQTIPLFFGSIPDAVRIALEEYGLDRIVAGDVIMVNDPYRVGTHLNDVCFIRPVFSAGELVGAVTIRAHMLDWGGRTIGGFEVTKTDLYEDGLVLPPTLLYSAGKPVKPTFSLILDNTRLGPIVLPDIQTIHTSLELGAGLLLETLEKYGLPAYLGGIRYACDAAAETMRNALERLPDGIYEGEERLDSDGLSDDAEHVVRVRINKRGGRAEFDLSGSSPATNSAINCSWLDAKTAVAIALKYLIDPKSPFTSASLRDVDVLLPADSIINPSPPHCCMFYWEPVLAIINATFSAINGVLGEYAVAPDSWGGTIHFASGVTTGGTPWFSSAGATVTPAGPWGATRDGDADSSQLMMILNLLDGGTEQGEADNPVVVLRRDYVPDTAGAGKHRSGSASVTDSLWLTPAEHRISTFHVKRPPGNGGVYGGRPGSLAGGWLWDPATSPLAQQPAILPLTMSSPIYSEATPLMGVVNPQTHELDPDGEYRFLLTPVAASANTMIRFVCNGAGGWGDALERDPLRVLHDVRDEYVTIEGAARDYGVVVTGDPIRDPEGLAVDESATRALRTSRTTSTSTSTSTSGT